MLAIVYFWDLWVNKFSISFLHQYNHKKNKTQVQLYRFGINGLIEQSEPCATSAMDAALVKFLCHEKQFFVRLRAAKGNVNICNQFRFFMSTHQVRLSSKYSIRKYKNLIRFIEYRYANTLVVYKTQKCAFEESSI